MPATRAPGLLDALAIQRRVVYALLMREVITRFGRYNLGVLWLVAEPMIFTLGVMALWTFAGLSHKELPVAAFAITGYSSVLMWRNAANRCVFAVQQNINLLYHRRVRLFDVFLARVLLELAGATASFTVLSVLFIAMGWMAPPADMAAVAAGWLMLAWFGGALAFVVGAATAYSHVVERLWHPCTYLLFPLSGAGFMADWFTCGARGAAVAAHGARRGNAARGLVRRPRAHPPRPGLHGHGVPGADAGGPVPAARRGAARGGRMIRAENVGKRYRTRQGPRQVLDNVNLSLQRGEHLGILGRNGAGKSTLIRLLSGAERPSTGRIHRDMSVSWPLAFGGAFQHNLTGLDNLKFVCRLYGVDHRAALPFVEAFTELGDYLREPVNHYSHGMVTRLAFALSMAVEFDCFLIDEAMVVGDARFHERCHVELFHKRRDRAFILVSHDADVIRLYCKRACVLHQGRLHDFASVDAAYDWYHAETAAPAAEVQA